MKAPVMAPRPSELPADSWETDGYYAKVTPYEELIPPVRRSDIPAEWRTEEVGGPFTQDGSVKQGYLYPVSTELVGKLVHLFPQMAEHIDIGVTERSTWLFQANPDYYNLAEELKRMHLGQEDDWTVSRYKDRIQPGDRVLLWQGGREAGIYAIGEIVGRPFQRTVVADWMTKRDGAEAKPDTAVAYRLTRILRTPVHKAQLQQHDVLKNMMVLRMPIGTNFAVTEQEWKALEQLIDVDPEPGPGYQEPSLEEIRAAIWAKGLRFSERTLRRYHFSLRTHGFVILSGVSGGGKTQLARAYASAAGAESLVVAVAPNWNTNEDLLGYFNPVHQEYVDTSFSRFLRRAAREFVTATANERTPRPYHLILDEMNLARVEQYFAKFLSAMELRPSGDAKIEVAPDELIDLTPNLMFIGTVNIDETTHGFANKIYDRAQLVEVEVPRELIAEHLAGKVYQEPLLEIWDRLRDVAPFAFRVLDEINAYVSLATAAGTPWQEALDDQLLQKIVPKLGGAEDRVGGTLDWLSARTTSDFPLTHQKVAEMAVRCHLHGFTSISRLNFLKLSGESLTSPEDWQPALLQVMVPLEAWPSVQLESNGNPLSIFLQKLGGEVRVLSEWPRSGPGSYTVRLLAPEPTETVRFSIKPAKISDGAFARLLGDLESLLPASIALRLQRIGGLVGLRLLPPETSTIAQEYQRLRRAVLGHDARPGLAQSLASIATDPHEVLQTVESWVSAERARRPVAPRLLQAVSRAGNLADDRLPIRVADAQVTHTYDVYENRLVKSFQSAVSRRLARLARTLARTQQVTSPATDNEPPVTLGSVRALFKQLSTARHQASFLDEVAELNRTPDRISMVLLNRPAYRAVLEGYYEFLRSVWVRLEEPALEAPLENFPYLYEVWGTLHVLAELIAIAATMGYVHTGPLRLAARDADGVFVRIMPENTPLLTVRHNDRRIEARFFFQRTFGSSGSLRSMSFTQIPDVTLEVRTSTGDVRLYLFDPKYKLDSQQDVDVGPKKEDIDKMDAYRDAIRGLGGTRIVEYAAILYPGPSRVYRFAESDQVEVAALTADPARPELLAEQLGPILVRALGG